MRTDPFVFDFQPGVIHYGRDCVADLGGALADAGCDRALVVCGSNVGANRELMDAVEAGLGDRHVGTYDGTTPDKRAETAVEAAARADELDADALVPVGGGSTHDVATVASVVRADGRDLADVRTEVSETGSIALPADPDSLTPLVPVPTTLAGADMTTVAGISVALNGEVVSTGVASEELMPAALFYDPALFETTPERALAGSAMNGFDKPIETLYSRRATAVTDATAIRSIRYLRAGLPEMTEDAAAMDRAVAGIVLAQYGISHTGGSTLSVVHAFGHGLRDAFGVQQGRAHAVVVPHVLRALFDAGVESHALEEAFDARDETGVVAGVERVRDALGLPQRLRDLEGATEDALEEAAERTASDAVLANAPPGVDVSNADARRILADAW